MLEADTSIVLEADTIVLLVSIHGHVCTQRERERERVRARERGRERGREREREREIIRHLHCASLHFAIHHILHPLFVGCVELPPKVLFARNPLLWCACDREGVSVCKSACARARNLYISRIRVRARAHKCTQMHTCAFRKHSFMRIEACGSLCCPPSPLPLPLPLPSGTL